MPPSSPIQQVLIIGQGHRGLSILSVHGPYISAMRKPIIFTALAPMGYVLYARASDGVKEFTYCGVAIFRMEEILAIHV
jgi:hypothetical protein